MNLTKQFTVTTADTADRVGSGALQVLATPTMIAWMENVAMSLVAPTLSEGDTTVGILINVQHLKASAVGEVITCSAELTATEGRKLSFSVTCTNAAGEVVGVATHDRFIVTVDRFMAKLQK